MFLFSEGDIQHSASIRIFLLAVAGQTLLTLHPARHQPGLGVAAAQREPVRLPEGAERFTKLKIFLFF